MTLHKFFNFPSSSEVGFCVTGFHSWDASTLNQLLSVFYFVCLGIKREILNTRKKGVYNIMPIWFSLLKDNKRDASVEQCCKIFDTVSCNGGPIYAIFLESCIRRMNMTVIAAYAPHDFIGWKVTVLSGFIVVLTSVYIYFKYFLYEYWNKRGVAHSKPTVPFGNIYETVAREKYLGESLNYTRCKLNGRRNNDGN